MYTLLHTLVTRPIGLLTCRGVLVEETGQSHPAEPIADGAEVRMLRALPVAELTYPIAVLPRATQRVLASLPATCPRR